MELKDPGIARAPRTGFITDVVSAFTPRRCSGCPERKSKGRRTSGPAKAGRYGYDTGSSAPQALWHFQVLAVRLGRISRTTPATSAMAPSTGGTATPSRFSVAISNGPASRIVSRSVQKTPPHTRATIPITTSTRPTPCLIDTFSSASKPQQEVCLCWPNAKAVTALVGKDEKIYEILDAGADVDAIVQAVREAVRARPVT